MAQTPPALQLLGYVLFLVYWLLTFSTVMAAWRWGQRDALVAALMVALSSSLTPIALAIIDTQWRSPLPGVFLLELALLIGLVILALCSDRYWPISVAALQLLAALTHPAYALDPKILPVSYAYIQGLWAWPMLLIVLWVSITNRKLKNMRRILSLADSRTVH